MKFISLKKIYLLSSFLLLIGCGGSGVVVTYKVPEQTNDGWKVSPASDVRIEVDKLSNLANSLQKINIQAQIAF